MVSEQEQNEFRAEVSAWLKENNPGDPGFLLPESFMEVGTDQQFEYLRNWQRKVYEAGYLGMSWPEEYGGRGMPQIFQDIVTKEMARQHLVILDLIVQLILLNITQVQIGNLLIVHH